MNTLSFIVLEEVPSELPPSAQPADEFAQVEHGRRRYMTLGESSFLVYHWRKLIWVYLLFK